jgi:dihydrofolate reductase
MKELKLLALVSIDGYSSRINGDMDWVYDGDGNPLELYNFTSFFESIDHIVMNRRQYLTLRFHDHAWPVGGKQCHVLTGKGMPLPAADGGSALRPNQLIADEERGRGALHFIRELRQSPGEGAIWVMGDHRLTATLLQNDMIDEINVLRLPVTLGSGVSFLEGFGAETRWSLVKMKQYPTGAIHTRYQRTGEALAV